MTSLTFHGAAETVTGSKYLLEDGAARVLIDCGLFQGLKALRQRNWSPLPFAPEDLISVVITHAHIDHIGYLPRLTKLGYQGPVYCTPATRDLAEVMLLDAADCQESDAEYLNRKGGSKHHPALPLYDRRDALAALDMLVAQPRGEWFRAAGAIWCRYHDAGHLLGSAMIEVEVRSGAQPTRILFSGDVGRYGAPLYHDPAPPPACDYLICESTYGDRDHPPENILDELSGVVQESLRRGGVILVSSFAVGRAQQLIYLLNILIESGRIPPLPIYLDSPMSVEAMRIYLRHASEHDLSEAKAAGARGLLTARNVHLVQSSEESKRLNDIEGQAIIIASSGMMTGGRILHHLRRRVSDPKTTILLGGYMAAGTRGRAIKEGAPRIRIFGLDYPVRAAVREISALSGHAGHGELLRWLEPLSAPRRVFLTHGELPSARALAAELRARRGWNTHVPKMDETVSLDPALPDA